MAASYLLLLRERCVCCFTCRVSPYANSLSCTTSMQHIAIARAIKSIDRDRLGEKRGRLSIDFNDIHELITRSRTFRGHPF